MTGGEGRSFSMVPLSWLGAGTAVVALVLYGLRESLRLPSGYGIEDLLGWSSPDIVHAGVQNWCSSAADRWRAAATYVLMDTAFFMPSYGCLILAVARGLAATLQSGPAIAARALKPNLFWVTAFLVGLAWIFDGVENFGGTQRLGVPSWAFLISLAIGATVAFTFWTTMTRRVDEQKARTCPNVGTLLVCAMALAAVVCLLDRDAVCEAVATVKEPFAWAWANHDKKLVFGLALAPSAFAALVWWFGIDLASSVTAQKNVGLARAAWRAGVAGVVGRSRYVLLLLAVFFAFTLVLDQCRDVLLALAGPREAGGRAALAWSISVLVIGALSVGMLAYSCWLWTRLIGMVERPGLTLPGAVDVYRQIGEFARGWSRAVSIAPLAILCLLVAKTTGDAVTAARVAKGTVADDSLVSTLVYLCVFGTLAICSGYVFLEVRRNLSLPDPKLYYDSESDTFVLLRTGTISKRLRNGRAAPAPAPGCLTKLAAPARRLLKRLSPLFRCLVPITYPFVLPLVALALMLALRGCMALWPDITSQAPATLALLCLSLVWWMGVLGALSLAEQRQTIPWGLALILVAGVLNLLHLVDNHVMPLTVLRQPVSSSLESMREFGLLVTGALGALAVVIWLIATLRYKPANLNEGTPSLTQRQRVVRAVGIVSSLAVVMLAMHYVDGKTTLLTEKPDAIDARHELDAVMQRWATNLPDATPADNVVYLVASEGGGARSAYWTAQVLAQLHDRDSGPPFDRRAVVLSGVSGGAVGEAVYVACLRQAQRSQSSPAPSPPPPISHCVRERFKKLDALSPLIGALMFEDVVARLLPVQWAGRTSLCKQPACGYLSRAQGFEREWMRQFSGLAEPLGRRVDWEPELMLNSTVVESGNRATFSAMRLPPRDTPSSEDPIDRLGAQPSLIAAAHAAARFPYINPLAALVPQSGKPDAGKLVAHLADGGYHDNSGAESLADAWRSLRPKLKDGWKVQLVLIRNGQLKKDCDRRDRPEPPLNCLTRDPAGEIDLAEPQRKSPSNLYTDLLGPAIAVVNVSGIGARARQAPAALDADIAASKPDPGAVAPALLPLLFDQTNEATLVPLGWYLSPAAREALDSQALCSVLKKQCPS